MKKTIISLLVITLVTGMLFTGCKNGGEETSGNDKRMKISVGFPGADETWKEDDYYKYITDKLNIDIDFKTLSEDSAAEKARIWIASGNMPDVTYAAYSLNEYLKYGQQGVIRELPSDWEEKYPNVGYAMAMTGVLNNMKKIGDGKIYGLVRALDHYTEFLDEFRAAYKEGKDLREMMGETKYRYIDSYGFAYRKDWAEKLGIKTDYIMEYDDFMDMVLKFKEADLGGVGAENTIGIAVDHTEAPNLFVTAYNSSYKYFHKDESGKYVYGLLEDSTAEGIKAYAEAYKKGILSKGFFTQKSSDLDALFCSQRSGVIFPRTLVRDLIVDFEKSNPGLVGEECIDVCWVLSPDGKIHGRESSNHLNAYYFNPEISDEKMDRILSLADYISSEEGGPQVRLGVPDVDYKFENGEYTILREKNANGVYESLNEKYSSAEFFQVFLNPMFDDEMDLQGYAIDIFNNLKNAKRQHELSLLNWDDERDAYAAEDYVKFKASYNVNSMLAEIVVADGDPEELWAKKRAEIEALAKPVVDNMNAALIK